MLLNVQRSVPLSSTELQKKRKNGVEHSLQATTREQSPSSEGLDNGPRKRTRHKLRKSPVRFRFTRDYPVVPLLPSPSASSLLCLCASYVRWEFANNHQSLKLGPVPVIIRVPPLSCSHHGFTREICCCVSLHSSI